MFIIWNCLTIILNKLVLGEIKQSQWGLQRVWLRIGLSLGFLRLRTHWLGLVSVDRKRLLIYQSPIVKFTVNQVVNYVRSVNSYFQTVIPYHLGLDPNVQKLLGIHLRLKFMFPYFKHFVFLII